MKIQLMRPAHVIWEKQARLMKFLEGEQRENYRFVCAVLMPYVLVSSHILLKNLNETESRKKETGKENYIYRENGSIRDLYTVC